MKSDERISRVTSTAPMGRGDYRTHGVMFAVLLVLGAVLYANSLNGEFVFDDVRNISENRSIRDLGDIGAIWDFNPMRVVGTLSFAVNYALSGNEVTGFHVLNVAIHILASWGAWWTAWLLLGTPFIKGTAAGRQRLLVAAGCALVFLVHPIQSQAVSYVVQRYASLMAMFYLFSLGCFIAGRLGSGGRRWVWYALSVVLALLAMFTKENAVTLPVAAVLVEVVFFRERTSVLLSDKRIRRYLAPFVVLLAIVPVVVFSEFAAQGGMLREFASDRSQDPMLTNVRYFLSQGRVLPVYLRLLVIPWGQTIDHDIPAAAGPFESGVIGGFLIGAALLFWGIRETGRRRLIGFGILWFFLTLSIESSFIILKNIMFEHRLYLPMFGVALAAVGSLAGALEKRPRVYWGVLAGVIAVYGVLTIERNRAWHDEVSLWTEATVRSPEKSRPWQNLGKAWLERNDLTQARACLTRALAIDPNYPEAHYNMGRLLLQMNDPEGAETHLTAALALWPEFPAGYLALGQALEARNDLMGAEKNYLRVLDFTPDHPDALNNLGIVAFRRGDFATAADWLNRAVTVNPTNLDALANLGSVFMLQGEYTKAVKVLEQALAVNPDHARSLNTLAWIYATSPDSSVRDSVRAVTLAERLCAGQGGEDPLNCDTLAAAYAAAGRFPDALKAARLALEQLMAVGDTVTTADVRRRITAYERGESWIEAIPQQTTKN